MTLASGLVFVLGAPASGVGRLAKALSRPPESVVRTDLDLGGLLQSLRTSTEERALRPVIPWQHPEPPPWLEEAVADFARLLVQVEGEGAKRLFGIAHAGSAAHLERLAGWFPAAKLVHLVRSGLDAPAEIALGETEASAALVGLAWAKRWAAHVGPVVDASDAAAGRVMTVFYERLEVDLPALAGALGLEAWSPMPVGKPAVRLQGAAAAGFACWEPARRLMAALGYAVPAPGAWAERLPALAAAHAGGLPHDLAVPALESALQRQSHALLWHALGQARHARGEAEAAALCWLAAIRAGNAPREAWVSLLGLPHLDASRAVAAAARCSAEPEIRAAAARWMVAQGLDHEAAEALADVRGVRWY